MRRLASALLPLLCAIWLSLLWSVEVAVASVLVVEGTDVPVDVTAGITTRVGFSMVNLTQDTIGIVSVESLCGCVQALADRLVFAPGERGMLEVVIDAEGRFGLARREVLLYTTAGGDPISVSFTVRYPPGPTLLPKFTYWERGAPTKPKQVIIGLPAEYHAAYSGLATSDETWFTIEEISRSEVGGERQILLQVTPLDTEKVRKSSVTFSFADGKELSAHVRIIEPKP